MVSTGKPTQHNEGNIMYTVWLFDKAGNRSNGNTFTTRVDAVKYAQDIVYPDWDSGWVRWVIQEQ